MGLKRGLFVVLGKSVGGGNFRFGFRIFEGYLKLMSIVRQFSEFKFVFKPFQKNNFDFACKNAATSPIQFGSCKNNLLCFGKSSLLALKWHKQEVSSNFSYKDKPYYIISICAKKLLAKICTVGYSELLREYCAYTEGFTQGSLDPLRNFSEGNLRFGWNFFGRGSSKASEWWD